MSKDYQKIIDYMVVCGKRIKEKSGSIRDIGVKKQYLTEEDIAIERGFVEIVKQFGPDHLIFAEEENFDFNQSDNVWVVDPISATIAFIGGLAHYSIVCSHLYKGNVVFAAVYDPSVDELFTAYKNKGAFLNSKEINIGNSVGEESIVFNLSNKWRDKPEARDLLGKVYDLNVYRTPSSFAVSYCWVAAGRYDGVIALTKDVFPEFAGKLLIEEAGGIFTNKEGQETISHTDRFFIGGSKEVYEKINKLINNG